MSNPIFSTLQELFRHLAFLTGILTHLENQHNNYSHLLKQELEKHGIDPSLMVAGSALAMRDLTQSAGNFRGYYPIGSFTSRNLEEYEKVLQVLLYRNSNWAVAQAYEAFETFLKNTISIYICENFDSVRMYLKKDIYLQRA